LQHLASAGVGAILIRRAAALAIEEEHVSPVFHKLKLKNQREIVVFNAPASFRSELAALKNVVVQRNPEKARTVDFSLAFVTTEAELDRISGLLACKASHDALLWFAYPKGTSRRYRCEFNRGSGWRVLAAANFRKVSIVAIDEDWSALRFRRIEHVKPKGAAVRAPTGAS
jgi:hypothetical protein